MVVVAGTACLDRIRRIEALPPVGGYAEVLHEAAYAGGEALNTAVALHRLGTEVFLAGSALAEDLAGELVRKMVQAEGLQTAFPNHPDATPACDIYVDSNGERTMFGHGFLEFAKYGLGDLPDAPSGAWFTIEPNLGEVAHAAYRKAKEKGWQRYAMDLWRDDDPLEPGDWWQSSTDWVGVKGDLAASNEWLQQFAKTKGINAILTDGANGLIWSDPSGNAKAFDPIPGIQVVDSTGAGDLFRAGMLYGLDQGLNPELCLAWGQACGAMACLSWGGASSSPTKNQVLEFGEQKGLLSLR